MSPKAPIELPKKRSLREAQQELVDSGNDLAQPINWGKDIASNSSEEVKIEPVNLADGSFIIEPPTGVLEFPDYSFEQENQNCIVPNSANFIIGQVEDNQKRPTVLVRVQDGESKQITSEDMQGAMTLVELKDGYNYNV